MELVSTEDMTDLPAGTWYGSTAQATEEGVYVWLVDAVLGTGETLDVEVVRTNGLGSAAIEAHSATLGTDLGSVGLQTSPLMVPDTWMGAVRVRHDAAGTETVSVSLYRL